MAISHLKYDIIPLDEVLTRLKQTQLMGYGQPYLYKTAMLELCEQVDPDTLVPAQRYVLTRDFQRIENLYSQFLQIGIDIFALKNGLHFEEQGEMIPLLPPIVEVSVEESKPVLLINDGMHRIFSARQLGKHINIILVSNIPKKYPYYAYPLKNGWQDVQVLETLTVGFVKKYYRDKENYKALFRNFNELFPNIQKQRQKVLSDV